MSYREQALTFDCGGECLFGIASVPAQPVQRGVVIVVGGPQYRIGSHRQFTLLARSLAAQGIAAMRFDFRGMGDSSGSVRSFEEVDADVRAAIDAFMHAVPSLREVVIWGLCDAASAALFYAANDSRVAGLVLLNPWVRTPDGHAKATIKHYYRDRLLNGGLWKKIFSGRFDYAAAATSLLRVVRAASKMKTQQAHAPTNQSLPDRMLSGLSQFKGKVLLILSGADLTAKEFSDLTSGADAWQRQMRAPRVTHYALAPADHTFSRREWRDQVAEWTCDWVRSW